MQLVNGILLPLFLPLESAAMKVVAWYVLYLLVGAHYCWCKYLPATLANHETCVAFRPLVPVLEDLTLFSADTFPEKEIDYLRHF